MCRDRLAVFVVPEEVVEPFGYDLDPVGLFADKRECLGKGQVQQNVEQP